MTELRIKLVESTAATKQAKDTIKQPKKMLVMIQCTITLKVVDILAMALKVGFEESGCLVKQLFSRSIFLFMRFQVQSKLS